METITIKQINEKNITIKDSGRVVVIKQGVDVYILEKRNIKTFISQLILLDNGTH